MLCEPVRVLDNGDSPFPNNDLSNLIIISLFVIYVEVKILHIYQFIGVVGPYVVQILQILTLDLIMLSHLCKIL